jgi:hypothetical protein
MSLASSQSFRKYHRFFLAGIMTVYALSGSLLIFRTTELLKYDQVVERQLDTNLPASELGKALHMRDFNATGETDTVIEFKEGTYNKASGLAVMQINDYHPVLQKMVNMHKATTNSPLFFLNLFFGASLLFFAVSSFLMFLPKAPQFRTGLKVAAGGALFAILVVSFGS